MTASLAPVFVFRAFDANGNPLVGGKLYAYAAGTSTPQNTFTDQSGTTPAANPLILDANGQTPLWLGSLAYKFNLLDSANVQQPGYPKDNVISLDMMVSTSVAASDSALRTDLVTPATSKGIQMVAGKALLPRTTTALTGSVTRTVADVVSDAPMVTALGLKGDSTGTIGAGYIVGSATDNAGLLSSMWSNHQQKEMAYPAGDYYFSTGVTFDYTTNNSSIFDKTNRVSFHGSDRHNTRLIHGGTGYLLDFTLGTYGAGTNSFITVSDLALINAKWDKTNSGIHFKDLQGLVVERMLISGFATGLYIEGACTTSAFRDIKIQQCTNGVVDDKNGSTSGPSNVLLFENVDFRGCSEYGFKGTYPGCNLVFRNCIFESNGPMGTATASPYGAGAVFGVGVTGGTLINFNSDNSVASVTFDNCYWEGNTGEADLKIVNNSVAPITVTLIQCSFMRVGASVDNTISTYGNYTGCNIKLSNTTTGVIRLNMFGCSMAGSAPYIETTSRPYIVHDTRCEIYDHGSAVSATAPMGVTPTWNLAPTHFSVQAGFVNQNGDNTLGPVNSTWSSSRDSAGIYTITHQGYGWGVDTQSYLVMAVSQDPTLTAVVRQVRNTTNKAFKVYTGLSTGAAGNADCSFAFYVVRVF